MSVTPQTIADYVIKVKTQREILGFLYFKHIIDFYTVQDKTQTQIKNSLSNKNIIEEPKQEHTPLLLHNNHF